MTDKINELLRRVEEFKPKAAAEIEEFRIRILGKKGELTALMEEFKTVAPELKRELGQQLNRLKNEATERINALLGTDISEADMIEYLRREEVPVVDGMIQVPSWRPVCASWQILQRKSPAITATTTSRPR